MDGHRMQNAELTWHGTVPVSVRFDDPYFSLDGGLAQARHVFLSGNDLPGRFRTGFEIAELGFGTGLSALAAWQAWQDTGLSGDLGFTSFEAWPMALADMIRIWAEWPELARLAALLGPALAHGAREISLPGLRLRVIEGDARETLPHWRGQADAWFLDGFSPAKNPQMWEAPLLAAVGARTAPGGTFATYSASGDVRRALAAASFDVDRTPGFGRKRHMTRGRLRADVETTSGFRMGEPA